MNAELFSDLKELRQCMIPLVNETFRKIARIFFEYISRKNRRRVLKTLLCSFVVGDVDGDNGRPLRLILYYFIFLLKGTYYGSMCSYGIFSDNNDELGNIFLMFCHFCKTRVNRFFPDISVTEQAFIGQLLGYSNEMLHFMIMDESPVSIAYVDVQDAFNLHCQVKRYHLSEYGYHSVDSILNRLTFLECESPFTVRELFFALHPHQSKAFVDNSEANGEPGSEMDRFYLENAVKLFHNEEEAGPSRAIARSSVPQYDAIARSLVPQYKSLSETALVNSFDQLTLSNNGHDAEMPGSPQMENVGKVFDGAYLVAKKYVTIRSLSPTTVELSDQWLTEGDKPTTPADSGLGHSWDTTEGEILFKDLIEGKMETVRHDEGESIKAYLNDDANLGALATVELSDDLILHLTVVCPYLLGNIFAFLIASMDPRTYRLLSNLLETGQRITIMVMLRTFIECKNRDVVLSPEFLSISITLTLNMLNSGSYSVIESSDQSRTVKIMVSYLEILVTSAPGVIASRCEEILNVLANFSFIPSVPAIYNKVMEIRANLTCR